MLTLPADGFGLVDYLGIERAQVVGAVDGGMIAQTMALEQPYQPLATAMTRVTLTTGETG